MTKEIQLTQGMVALVDDSDYEWLSQHKWCASKCRKTYNAVRGVGPKKARTIIAMHRIIMNPPTGFWVDHKDGNGLNNTRENLRVCTRSQNQQNRGKNKNNTSGYKGVYWCKQSEKWYARIDANGKHIGIGQFRTAEEAGRAYDEAAKKYHGEFAWTNFKE